MLICKLIFVDPVSNHNKFYNMVEKNGEIEIEFGRVGAGSQKAKCSTSQFSSKKLEKLRKGYIDVTHFLEEKSSELSFDGVDPNIKLLFETLLKYANESVVKNYNLNLSSVTELQIKDAQTTLDNIAKATSIEHIQTLCRNLFIIFPRKMHRVVDYIPTSDWSTERLNKFLSDEQDTLDSLKGMVTQTTSNLFDCSNYNLRSIDYFPDLNVELAALRIRTPKKIFRVEHNKQSFFDEHVNQSSNKTTRLLIHGSRSQNILSILKNGLLIRPTGAYYSGSAYGDGVYHADVLDKSLGYCGYTPDKFIMIQDVHLGNTYQYTGRNRHDKPTNFFTETGLQKEGCDSLFAKGGNDLINNEYIVYNSKQTIIKYLLWY